MLVIFKLDNIFVYVAMPLNGDEFARFASSLRPMMLNFMLMFSRTSESLTEGKSLLPDLQRFTFKRRCKKGQAGKSLPA